MPRRLDIDRFCAKHHNEDAHARHVAGLALSLFDGARSRLAIPASDRKVLEAAALLHDIGFAEAPEDHARVGAQLVLREGLPGLTAVQRRTAAVAILLHAPRYKGLLRNGILTGLNDRRRALRLAAILRIADGLDHGHMQDTAIRRVAFRGGSMALDVTSRAYVLNGARAASKADLFRDVFGLSTSLTVRGPADECPLLEGVVTKSTDALCAARLVLSSQYRAMLDQEADTIAGGDPEYLHDLRVGARRFRFALRFFGPLLRETSAEDCERAVAGLCRQLGPARDAQVQVAFIADTMATRGWGDRAEWQEYHQHERQVERRAFRALRRILRSDGYRAVTHHMARLVRVEVPDRERCGGAGEFSTFAVRRLRKLYRRLEKTELDPRRLSPAQLHELRKDCRKERYRAEFAAGALGPAISRLSKQLRLLTNTLGTVHDVDLRLEAARDGKAALPSELRKVMRAIRREALAGFRSGWKAMQRRGNRRDVRAVLVGGKQGHRLREGGS